MRPRFEWLRGPKRWHRGFALGRIVVQLTENATGAPWCDEAYVVGGHWQARGKAISVRRRRNAYGERIGGAAVFIGLRP